MNFGRTLQIFPTSRAMKAIQMLLHRSKVIKCPYCTVPGAHLLTVPKNRIAFPLLSCPGQAGPKGLFQSNAKCEARAIMGEAIDK